MAQETLYLIITGVGCLLVGILLASIFSSRGSRKPSESDEAREVKKEGYAAVANLWYSPATKRIIMELEETFYREFENLTPEQQKKTLRLAELFAMWVKPSAENMGLETLAEPVEEPPLTAPAFASVIGFPSETEPVQKPGSTKPLPFVDADDAATILPTSPVSRVSPTPAESALFAEPQDAAEPQENGSLKAKTVAGQISDIIYQMLKTSPLREKGVKLIEREDHGVDVWFGMEKFDGVDSVPYPEVRQLIKEAVTRWEREMRDKPAN
jgi:hypothetical protein